MDEQIRVSPITARRSHSTTANWRSSRARTLVAGMPVEAYVQTGERTPFNYLLKPFTDYLNRAWLED